MPSNDIDVLALLKAKNQATATADAPKVATASAPSPLKDDVVETLEVTITAPTPRKHTVEIIKKVDPAQVYPFLAQCSCGFQARTYSANTAHDAAEEHLGRAKQPIVR